MNQQEQSYRRILVVLGIFFGTCILLTVRLFDIQIWNHRILAKSGHEQRRAVLLNSRLRGVFLDRHGVPLRNHEESWYLVVERSALEPQELLKLDIILDTGWRDEFQKNPNQAFWVYPKPLGNYQKKLLDQFNIQGVNMMTGVNRYQETQPLAWHILGLVSRGQGFSGLESLYNPIVGKPEFNTAVFTINDGHHRAIPGLGLRIKSAKNNATVILTLDRHIQQIVERVMDRESMKGAVVVLDALSGDILAMASRPLVNVNNLAASLTDNNSPFINRAVSAYHPGSIFKLVILAAGLDSGLLRAGDRFFDAGYYEAGSRQWYCSSSKGLGHGWLTVTEALAYSCNPVFIEMMISLGPGLVLKYADKFGLGQPCNIGLRDECWGEISAEMDLTVGEQANIALGEGNIYTTPLQIASLIQTIAGDGVRKIPRLVTGYVRRDGSVKTIPVRPGTRIIRLETARQIQMMMAEVVAMGTGMEAQIPGTGVAGKTGTAQRGNEPGSPEHAWFAGFAPVDRPRYVAVVFCEQGISGGKTAAPIFREIMERVMK